MKIKERIQRLLLKRAGLLSRYRIPLTREEHNQHIRAYIKRHPDYSVRKIASIFKITINEVWQILGVVTRT